LDIDLSSWDTSSVRRMDSMFAYAEDVPPGIDGWDTSSVENMQNMFLAAKGFDLNLGAWSVAALEHASAMLDGSGLSTENYAALLIGWAAQSTQMDVDFGAETIQYSAAATAARAVLTDERGWAIEDAGLAP
jgi:trimeric autotransporter adhesin